MFCHDFFMLREKKSRQNELLYFYYPGLKPRAIYICPLRGHRIIILLCFKFIRYRYYMSDYIIKTFSNLLFESSCFQLLTFHLYLLTPIFSNGIFLNPGISINTLADFFSLKFISFSLTKPGSSSVIQLSSKKGIHSLFPSNILFTL